VLGKQPRSSHRCRRKTGSRDARHQIGETEIGDRQVTVDTAMPRAWSISEGMAKPTPQHLRARRRDGLLNGFHHAVEQGRAVLHPPQAYGLCGWTFKSASTAPARSFVPPRSTPITQPGGMMGHHTDLDAESS